ncbi:uncharacterized protein LOC135825298 [Sycon ciliatum]|uniref:uncharacterized protein LOC135825298 n=1 Tax=Sycon ciliatum TaxID=27933 RepID=UPI0020A9BD13|eukprot:scpid67198/ scgid29097/ 
MIDVTSITDDTPGFLALQLESSGVPDVSRPAQQYARVPQRELDDEQRFMECIRKHCVLYDRTCPEHRDCSSRNKAWTVVCMETGQPLNHVKKRYNTVRTRLSRYVKAVSNGLGEGWMGSLTMPRELEHLHWLVVHIRQRKSTLRAERKSDSHKCAASASEDDVDYGDVFPSAFSDEAPLQTSLTSPSSSSSSSTLSSPTWTNPQPGIGNLIAGGTKGTIVTKRMRHPQQQSTVPASTADVTSKRPHASSKPSVVPLDPKTAAGWCDMDDEDGLFCLSMVSHLKNLPPAQRSWARIKLQSVLHDAEFGSAVEPRFAVQTATLQSHPVSPGLTNSSLTNPAIETNIRPSVLPVSNPQQANHMRVGSQNTWTGVSGVVILRG